MDRFVMIIMLIFIPFSDASVAQVPDDSTGLRTINLKVSRDSLGIRGESVATFFQNKLFDPSKSIVRSTSSVVFDIKLSSNNWLSTMSDEKQETILEQEKKQWLNSSPRIQQNSPPMLSLSGFLEMIMNLGQ